MKTTIIDHDFETFCDLDVRKVGAFRYAQHKSCDVLLLSWGTCAEDLRTWQPHLEPKMPADLRKLAEDPAVLFQAHNASFEYCIWQYVMTRRYKAPVIEPHRFVCTAVMCAAAGLPRSLSGAGTALELDEQKDKEGTRLINLFCKMQKPKKPTKKNPKGVPAYRIQPADRPEDWDKFVAYNRRDVVTEIGIVKAGVPRLSPIEQKYFALDLVMNTRGLPLDMKAVRRAMPVVTELEDRINRKVTELTGGIRPTQVAKMLEFFNGLGLDMENMQAKTVKDLLLLKGDELTPDQKLLLQLRVEGGKASTKKLKTMLLVVCEDGRVRGGFLFFGAHTGRWAGRLIQPQNFTRGEYSPDQLEQLIQVLYLSDADVMEILYEWPVDAVAQGMRGFIRAPKGKKFVVCDFSAIEARMLAWLAQETEVLKVYHANGDVYIRMASKLYKIPEETLLRLVKVEKDKTATGQRKFAKDIVLGSLSPETIVITAAGPKRIIDVLPTDKVWDGIEWVPTCGAIYTGHKEVIEVCGIRMTPDHKVFTTNSQYHLAEELRRSASLSQSALALAASSSPAISSASEAGLNSTSADVTVVEPRPRILQNLSEAVFTGVQRVWGDTYLKNAKVGIGACDWKSAEFMDRIGLLKKQAAGISAYVSPAGVVMNLGDGSSINIPMSRLQGAATVSPSGRDLQSPTPNTVTCTCGSATCTSDARPLDGTLTSKESQCASDGTISASSPPTVCVCRGTSQDQTNWNLTGSVVLETTNPVTVALSHSKPTSKTSDVFDLLECGPRNRFTIIGDNGQPLIVHNCGYQMGGPGFYMNCIKRGILVEEDECKTAVKVYRNEHPKIVKFWYDVEKCAIRAVQTGATKENPIVLRNLSFYVDRDWFCIKLPSGRPLRYHKPKLAQRERFGKIVMQLSYRSELKGRVIRETTYGGKLVENIVQAVSRDVMVESMYRAEKAGYPCVGTVHDELIAEVDEDFGSAKELEEIMCEKPRWAMDAPINAEGWEGRRYRK